MDKQCVGTLYKLLKAYKSAQQTVLFEGIYNFLEKGEDLKHLKADSENPHVVIFKNIGGLQLLPVLENLPEDHKNLEVLSKIWQFFN